ncbi:hypothetical protein Nepgr_008270 [Nepenthes gracilis]|uniref:Pentatricopeptide repeat-containing protein n=1 Tax=Nepenthes gracilis TaxID=150966 RepID=A0AAD3S8Q9_NEPGR|nr:hypothetical protein Nepgr_008270 [Nepenthes gracilis]
MPSTCEVTSLTSRLIQKCASIAILEDARQLHALILICTPISDHSPFLHNNILSMYAKCGSLAVSRLVFDKMPHRNIVSYNSLMSAYARNPNYAISAFTVLSRMRYDCFTPNVSTFTSLLHSASSLGEWFLCLALHCQIMRFGFLCDAWVQTALLGLYSNFGDIESANTVFESIDVKDAMAWNCIISGNLKNKRINEGLYLFSRMLTSGVVPTEFTYSMVLSGCARLGDYSCGQLTHARVIVTNVPVDLPLQNALLDMYSSCCDTQSALNVFRGIENPDLVSWNSILSGYAETGDGEKAMHMFILLLGMSEAEPDEYTFAAVISAVGELPASYYGEPLHAQVIRFGCDTSVFVGSTLISMYFKNVMSESAGQVFYSITKKDVVLWTEMISGYLRLAYGEKAVKLFFNMWQEGHRFDSFALSSMLSACADLTTLKQGEMVHCQAIKNGCDAEISVCGSLVDMYSKNGHLQAAKSIFSKVENPDLKCWNSMIGGYSLHGNAEEALKLFDDVLDHRVNADHVTFISLLSACSHCGLVEKGKYLWNVMKDNKIVAGEKHYSCMVSLLSRAGLLEETEKMINESPFRENCLELWRTLLSSSVANKNLAVGLRAAEMILALNAEDSGTHMLLSNLYAATGRWDSVMEIRRRIRGLTLQKDPGLSWVEVTEGLNVFSSGEQSHPKIEEVRAMLHQLQAYMTVRSDMDEL